MKSKKEERKVLGKAFMNIIESMQLQDSNKVETIIHVATKESKKKSEMDNGYRITIERL